MQVAHGFHNQVLVFHECTLCQLQIEELRGYLVFRNQFLENFDQVRVIDIDP